MIDKGKMERERERERERDGFTCWDCKLSPQGD